VKETYVKNWRPGDVGCSKSGLTLVRLIGGALIYTPTSRWPTAWGATEPCFRDFKAVKNPKLKLIIKIEESKDKK
jgi:hypothetical protein